MRERKVVNEKVARERMATEDAREAEEAKRVVKEPEKQSFREVRVWRVQVDGGHCI